MDKLVTVITPLYNAQNYIAQTIESVLAQTYGNWEMIIIDNCSTDESRNIVKSFADNRIKLIELEYNSGGPARPRNIGIENAKGAYIAFLDSDDIWVAEKLKIQVDTIENGNYDIVHTYANTIDIESKITGIADNQRIYKLCKYFMSDKSIIYLANYVNINSVLMKKDIVIKFREDKNMIAIEDWMYWIENILADKKVYLIKQYLLNYRVNINSISSRSSDKSFRKVFYLYSILLIELKISYKMFCFSGFLNFFRIGYRIITNLLKNQMSIYFTNRSSL